MLGMSAEEENQNILPQQDVPIIKKPVIEVTSPEVNNQAGAIIDEAAGTGQPDESVEMIVDSEMKNEVQTELVNDDTPKEATEKPATLVREQLRYCATLLKGLKRHPQSVPFQAPVDPVALNIPDYFDVIKHPMDLSAVSKKLTGGEYKDAEEFVSDVRLMLSNCFTYNHPESQVYKMGRSLEKYFENAVNKMPIAVIPPPAAFADGGAEKGGRKRNEGSTTPLSAGRVKREPQAPRRLSAPGSASGRGRKPSSNAEMAFCNSVLKELFKKQHQAITWPFMEPVDAISLGIPDYFDVIKYPMDLSTVRRKLETVQYTNAEQFEADIRLIITNCYTYNAPDSDVVSLCRAFEKLLNQKWAQKPSSVQPPTPTIYAHPSSNDDYDSDSEKILEINRQIQALQQELSVLLMKRRSRPSIPQSKPRKQSKPRVMAAPQLTEDVFYTIPMTFDEKRKLSEEVNNLNPDRLGRVVEIIQAGMALETQGESDVIELDIESLNIKTLRQLQKYVMESKGITNLASMVSEEALNNFGVKRRKSSAASTAPPTKKAATGNAAKTPSAQATAAAAAAVAMSSEEESSEDEDA